MIKTAKIKKYIRSTRLYSDISALFSVIALSVSVLMQNGNEYYFIISTSIYAVIAALSIISSIIARRKSPDNPLSEVPAYRTDGSYTGEQRRQAREPNITHRYDSFSKAGLQEKELIDFYISYSNYTARALYILSSKIAENEQAVYDREIEYLRFAWDRLSTISRPSIEYLNFKYPATALLDAAIILDYRLPISWIDREHDALIKVRRIIDMDPISLLSVIGSIASIISLLQQNKKAITVDNIVAIFRDKTKSERVAEGTDQITVAQYADISALIIDTFDLTADFINRITDHCINKYRSVINSGAPVEEVDAAYDVARRCVCMNLALLKKSNGGMLPGGLARVLWDKYSCALT